MAKKKELTPQTVQQRYNISVLPNDRSRKALQDWHQAIEAAESLYAPERKTLYDLYLNTLLDTHVSAVVQKRVLAITNTPWVVVDKAGQKIDDLSDDLNSSFFEHILTYCIESKLYGHSLMEIDWPSRRVELIPRAHVNPRDKIVVPNPLSIGVGVAYNQPPFDRNALEAGQPDDLGLLLKIAPYAILKRNDISDWATFCEIFGMPLRVVYYDPSLPSNRTEASNAMKEMGGAGYLVLPDGSRVEFPSSGSQQGNDTYDRFADFCNAEISKAIVGQTMTTEVGKNGSRSQGEVHMTAENRLAQNDLKFVERTLNERLIPLLAAQGVALPEGARFQPVEEEQELDKAERFQIDLQIHQNVGAIPKTYWQKEYNVEFVDIADSSPTPDGGIKEPPPSDTKKVAPLKVSQVKNADSFLRNFLDFFGQAPK